MKYRTLIILSICFVAGCTNPINMNTADRYYNLGVDAEMHGDLTTAYMYYSRSYGNTVLGNAPPLSRAHALYEYSRVSGYLGHLAEAEKGFNDTIALLDQVPADPSHLRAPTHSEHAKLLFANRRYRESISEFQKAIVLLDELSIESRFPGDTAVFLSNYAEALRAVHSYDQAEEIEKRVTKIHTEHPNAPLSSKQVKYVLAEEIPQTPNLPPQSSSSKN